MNTSFEIRDPRKEEAAELLLLMQELAIFENYIQDFKITKEDLLERGFGHAPQFLTKVAVANGQLQGMAVFYVIPYTFDLKPVVVLKELYVKAAWRSKGLGQALMGAVVEFAQAIKASAIIWLVMKGNHAAEEFYRHLGGQPDPKWDRWVMPLK